MRKKSKENSLLSTLVSALAIRTAKYIIYKATNSDPNTKLLTVPMELMLSEFVTDKSVKQNLQTGSLLNASIDLMQLGMVDTPIYAETRKDKKTIRDILRDISFNFDPILDVAYFMDGIIHLSNIEKPIFFLRGQILFILNGTEDFIRWISVTGTRNKKFQSLEELIIENRASYFKYIRDNAGADLGGPQNQNDVTINKPGSGKNNYIAFPQGISFGGNFSGRGELECFGSTLVYTMMHLGFMDGSLTNEEITRRYLTFTPTSKDKNKKSFLASAKDVVFNNEGGRDYRGRDEGALSYFGTGKTLYYDRIEYEILKFQKSDFSKLMGNDQTEFKLYSLRNLSTQKIIDVINAGYPVHYTGNQGHLFGDSAHHALVYNLKPTGNGKYMMHYIDPFRNNNKRPESNIAIKKMEYAPNGESEENGLFNFIVMPKVKLK